MKPTVQDALADAIIALFDRERFYAELVLNMDRKVSKRVPTLGVCVKDRVELIINPDFFTNLTLAERVALLKHECAHVLHDHISRSKALAPDVYDSVKQKDVETEIIDSAKHRSINIACDIAINSGIRNLPEGFVHARMFDLPNYRTMEWYYENLKNNEKAKNFMQIDNHDLWAESEGGQEILRQTVKKLIKDAATKTRAAGKMTSEDELLISKFLESKVSWKSELSRFAARQIETNLDTSKKKRNRRYGILYPGTVKTENLHIGVALDTSGSVSDEALHQFMAEINKISKYAKVTVVEADSEIKNHYVYDPKKKYTIKGRGGTAYKPAFDWFNLCKEKVDGVIYFGDMDCFDKEEIKKPRYPVLWAIVGDQEPPATWGSKLRIEVESKNV